jgi:hypothetical protein
MLPDARDQTAVSAGSREPADTADTAERSAAMKCPPYCTCTPISATAEYCDVCVVKRKVT